jgi:hypothetical protein
MIDRRAMGLDSLCCVAVCCFNRTGSTYGSQCKMIWIDRRAMGLDFVFAVSFRVGLIATSPYFFRINRSSTDSYG